VRWFDFAQRAALHAVAPHLQASEQQNLELQAQKFSNTCPCSLWSRIPGFLKCHSDIGTKTQIIGAESQDVDGMLR